MKKRMAKIVSLALTAAMVVPTTAQIVAAEDDKEIVYWNIATESPDKDIVEAAVEKFNAETESGYTVTSVPTQNDTYKEKLVVAMSSGECPDMYSSWSGGPMFEYIDSGFAQPIDDLYEASEIKDKLLDSALAQATYNDHIYAIPYLNVSLAGIFYNKDMFEEYGLEEPTTLAELENICATLKENGITPFALANGSKWTGSMYFMSLAARYGGLEPFQNAVAGEGSFTDDCFIKAGEKIQEWVNAGYFPEGVNSLSEDDGQAKQLMYQETAGMLLCGSWYTGTFASDSEEFYQKIGWFPFPAIEDSDADATIQIGTVGDQFISFNCEGDKLAAAFECAEQHLSDEVTEITFANNKIAPINEAADKITDPVVAEIFEAAQNASEIQLWYDQYLPPAVASAHLDGLQEVFGLTKTPQEAQESMQAAMDEYLSQKAE
ncbi:MAG: extracellular solute-binding protein [Eubacteriales bacterium]|nr:extracellular solute-binding protein [Eubacteriales bacterium]